MTKPTCYHQNKRIVWTTVGGDGEPLAGVRQLRHQCADCGCLIAGALPHSRSTPDTPNVDLDALRRWIDFGQAHWNQRRLEAKANDEQRQREWRSNYEDYLQSERWKAKRRKVFNRCGGLCEGCGEYRATEVHHLSYAHLGNELLWELAAVCRDCHERAHNENGIRNFARASHHHQVDGNGPLLRDVPAVFEQEKESSPTPQMSRSYGRK